MKSSVAAIIIFLLLTTTFNNLYSQTGFSVNHGPYLQELTGTGVTIIFTTNKPAFSWIELTDKSGITRKCYQSVTGLKAANSTFNAIRINDLNEAEEYSYSVQSKEIVKFEPYSVVFRDSLSTPKKIFRTQDKSKSELTFIELSDIHGNNDKLQKLLNLAGVNTADMVIYNGDMVDYISKEDQPFTGFIDKSVELFAGEKPIIYARGNHETRGWFARDFYKYFQRADGRYYYTYRQGPVLFIVLDSGEDKPDTHPVYAGLVDFDAYRNEQTQWLEELVKTKEFKKAPFRIVISHIPPEADSKNYTPKLIATTWMPLLNKAGIDLMICGHQHTFSYKEPVSTGNNFPILTGSNNSVLRVLANNKQLSFEAIDVNGAILGKKEIKKR